jgi:fructose-1,6-bisphosphatase/inositol monophosphatase family enzyme/phosphoglycolate phosphatase-like HAD superfamily hydrolase
MFTCSAAKVIVSTLPEALATPRLLALDVGGVLVETFPTPTDWAPNFAAELIADARRALGPETSLPAIEEVAADLRNGREKHDAWKDRDRTGAELSQDALWSLLSQPRWGIALLDHVARHRSRLTAQLCLAWETRVLRPGIPQLLEHCRSAGIAVCVVSNTISGVAYRTVLEREGLAGCFANSSFSDEVGIRKPDPRLLIHGVQSAGSTLAETWYVGDTYRRDVTCGRRARVACTILMRSRRTEPEHDNGPLPDVVVDHPDELLAMLKSTLPDGRRAASARTKSMRSTPVPSLSTRCCATARRAALDVGPLLVNGFRQDMNIDLKADFHDVVTKFDRAAEARIREIIEYDFPGSTVIGEEDGPRGDGSPTWYVDPIDGTSNFARGIAFWCVSIAAVVDGEVIAGVIYDPVGGNTFTADDTGARLNGEPIHARGFTSCDQATVLAHYPMPADLAVAEDFSLRRYGALVKSFSAVRNTSSGALCLAHVAAGWADATFNFGTNPWDVAAGSFLLKLAGGRYRAYTNGDEQPAHGDFLASDYYAHVADADFPIISRTMQEGSRLRSGQAPSNAPIQ